MWGGGGWVLVWMCVFSRDVDVSEVGGRCWCRCEKVSVGVWVLGLCECGCVVLGDIGLWCGFFIHFVLIQNESKDQYCG